MAVLAGSRFMDAGLADKLSVSLGTPVTPVMMLNGIAINQNSGIRVNNTAVIGIDSTFSLFSDLPLSVPGDGEAVIGRRLAERLGLDKGDNLLVRVESAGLIPVNSPFAQESVPSVALRLTVKDIATDEQLGMFSLKNDQTAPLNIFVSLSYLGERMDLGGLANTYILADGHNNYPATRLYDSIRSVWSLTDLGAVIKNYPDQGTFDLTSNRIFIDTAIQNVIRKAGLEHSEILTYLVNDIGLGDRHTPYSFASAVPSSLAGMELGEDEVIINRWTAEDLRAAVGDSVEIDYYVIGPLRQLHETSRRFIIKGITSNTSGTINRSLMPDFQGFSEAGNCSDWNAGVPVDLERIRVKDEQYWDDYRGTPKVLLSPETGQSIWHNQFGSLTALRFDASEVSPDDVSTILLNNITPQDLGIMVVDLLEEGITAAGNSVNFTELFLGMSFFVIAAGILLTVLIYSLHFSRRSSESALLSSLGFSEKRILRLRLAESSLVIVTGSIAGALIAVLYNKGILSALNTIWNDIVRTDALSAHIRLVSLFIGAAISSVVAMIPVFRVTARMMKKPLALQIKGFLPLSSVTHMSGSGRFPWGIALIAVSLGLVMYAIFTGAAENAVLYLTASALFITGNIFVLSKYLHKKFIPAGITIPSPGKLALNNLKRNPGRSLAVVSLLAIGTFTIVLIGSYRKTFYGTENLRESGTGGYQLWAETTSTIPFDMNSSEGRQRFVVNNSDDLNNVRFLQFHSLDGDDASCLNLNQVQRPRLLAVDTKELDSVKAFSFTGFLPEVDDENPWKSLNLSFGDNIYPAYADKNVIQYSLQKKLGDTLVYLDESGNTFRLVLSAATTSSVFQGNILISDSVFSKHFPSSGGSRVLLVETPAGKQDMVAGIMSRSLVDYGIEITSTSARLAEFNSVENTYLSVFMALSGLGFIIGTIGLGIVLLRNIHERRQELAMMLSLGFSRKLIFRIVFSENLMLLAGGLLTGLLAALVGIMPSLLSPSFTVQGLFLIVLTGAIFMSGLAWIYFPLRSALNKPLVPALRIE